MHVISKSNRLQRVKFRQRSDQLQVSVGVLGPPKNQASFASELFEKTQDASIFIFLLQNGRSKMADGLFQDGGRPSKIGITFFQHGG